MGYWDRGLLRLALTYTAGPDERLEEIFRYYTIDRTNQAQQRYSTAS